MMVLLTRWTHGFKTTQGMLACVLAIGWLTGSDGQAQEASRAPLPPVTQIILYNSGLAQVIREGTVEGNQQIDVPFDKDSIDDVLKSIVFSDPSGKIRSVMYQPAPARTDVAAWELGPPMTVAQMLQNYRGESITLTLDSSQVSGRIVGVENRNLESSSIELVTLLDDRGLTSWPLTDIKRFQFDDESLQQQLQLGMQGLSKSRSAEQQALTLQFEGEGKRPIRFAYVVDAPVWRMTYRLDLGEKASSLQGWAHVDNVTGNDWNQVQLDLRSGRPQSFHADIFAPLVAQRMRVGSGVFGIPPDLNVVQQSIDSMLQDGYLPTPDSESRFTGGWSGGFGGGGFGGGGGLGGGGFGGGGLGSGLAGQPQFAQSEENLDISASVQAAASQDTAARMVRFLLEDRVNLESGKSAMVPVLNSPIQPARVTRFDLDHDEPAAELVVKFSNDTPFAMLAGPVAIYHDGSFVGDARLPRTDLADSLELVYGTDPSLTVQSKSNPVERRIREVEFASDPADKARIRLKGTETVVRRVTIENKDSAKRTVLLKVDLHGATSNPPPDETEESLASFQFDVPAASKSEKELAFATAFEELKPVQSLDPDMLAKLNRAGTSIAGDVLELANRMNQLNESIRSQLVVERELTKQADALKTEQTRLAGLIDSLKDDASAKQTFVNSLVQSEAELSAINEKIEQIQSALESLRSELAALLKNDQ